MNRVCHITIRDEVFCYITGLQPSDNEFLWKKFGIFKDGYFFAPKYKLGQWDGKIRFFEKTGKTYIRLLDDILELIVGWGYEIALHDERMPVEVVTARLTEDWFAKKGATFKGQPILIRPYQLEAVNNAIEYGDGFIEAGTGAGKSLMCAGLCDVYGSYGYRTITVVPSTDLVNQTAVWYEICKMEVGIYSGSEKDISKQHVVATWQSLQNNCRRHT